MGIFYILFLTALPPFEPILIGFYFYTRDIVRLLYIHGCLLLRLGPKRAIPLNIK